MLKANSRISNSFAGFALALTMIAFALGSAPFTPAMILAVVAIPIVITSLLLGAWRVSLLAIYWAVAAFLTVPLAQNLSIGVDDVLIFLGVGGLALSALSYFSYTSIKNVA